jgi:hypothetical protein
VRADGASYTLTADTATDPKSDLMWQRKHPKVMHRWEEARDYCDALSLEGHDDWHLPSRLELLMIVDYAPASPSTGFPDGVSEEQQAKTARPLIDTAAFPETPPALFWTASNRSDAVWTVDFATGYFELDPPDLFLPRTRCVRSGKAPSASAESRYVKTSSTVTETATGLVWESQPTLEAYSEAVPRCQSLTLDGSGGFHVPTLKELSTLLSAVARGFEPGTFQGASSFDNSYDAFWTSVSGVDDKNVAGKVVVSYDDQRLIVTSRLVKTGEGYSDDSVHCFTLCVRDKNVATPSSEEQSSGAQP